MSQLRWRSAGAPPFERLVATTPDVLAIIRPLANANGSGFDWSLQARHGGAWLTGWAADEPTARRQVADALPTLPERVTA